MLDDFFRAVLPDEGHYCLVLLPEGRHIWTDTTDGLAQLATNHEGRHGVYFGTAAFATSDNRKSTNVLALKALRLDVDAGEKKHATDPDGTYPNQKEALAALLGFIKLTGTAPSYIISSGEGLHVYYCLDESLPPAEWLRLAEGLSNRAAMADLRVDTKVTTDTARVLRPLGGLHQNGSRVTCIKATGRTYSASQLASVFPAPRKFDTSINDDAISAVEGPPSSALKIVKHCAALHKVAEAKGDVQEPFWRAMLGVVKFTVEGDELAQEWSMGYDGYDERETARKLANWATGPTTCNEFSKHCKACGECEYQGKIKSPIVLGRMTAEQIEKLPEEKKPPVLEAPAPTGKPWDGRIPAGFDVVDSKHGGHTLVCVLEEEREDETGEIVPVKLKVPITHEIYWFSHWADAEASGDTAQITIHKYDEMTHRVKAYEFPSAAMASKADTTKKLAELGIHVTTDKRAMTANDHYLKAQLQRIKNTARRVKVLDRFGLRILDDGSLVAVHGEYVIRADGTISRAIMAPGLQAASRWFTLPIPSNFEGEWAADTWDQHINPAAARHVEFMRTHYGAPGMEKYQLAFMLSLASPLMAFVTGSYRSGATLPANGLSVSLYEREGGKGKSTLMKAAMLAYGNAEDLSKDQNASGSTDLARVATLSMMGTMPAAFDEMGRMGEKSASNLISSIANGTARSQATKEMGLRTGAKWALICLISTNRSQRDMVTVSEAESSAVQYRLLELDMNNMPDFDHDARAAFSQDWSNLQGCAGALGAVIQRFICQMGAERANEVVMNCVAKASKLVDADKEDRFQYRALGAMLALQLILDKLGLRMFDTKAMLDCFIESNEAAKIYVKENTLPTDGLDLLNRFLHDIRPNTVITEDFGFTKGMADRRRYVAHLGGRVPDKVDARYVKDQGVLYVSQSAMRDWCKQYKVRDTELMQAAVDGSVWVSVYPNSRPNHKFSRFNLLRGMAESTDTQVMCAAFKVRRLAQLTGPEIEGEFEDVDGKVVPLRREGPEEAAA